MARGVNKVTLVGNLGADPEVRTTAGGTKVANFSLATSESWTKDGVKREETQWHRLVLWSGLADVAERFLKKGDRVYVEGKLKYGKYEKDGITRYTTDINVRELVMLSGSTGSGVAASAPVEEPQDDDSGSEPSEDDLPF